MKKIILLSLLTAFALGSYAQQGDMSFGTRAGYLTMYKRVMYGVDFSYHLTDPLEVNVSGLLNPSIEKYDEYMRSNSKIDVYSANLDLRFYLLNQRSWGMGPVIGGSYMHIKKEYLDISSTDKSYSDNPLGFDIGWHMRFNLTEQFKVNAGWRYTSAKDDYSYHLYYIGLNYTFNVF